MPTSIFKFCFTLFFLLKLGLVFSQEELNKYVVVKEFKVIGNKTTKENIIIREIPFSINDTLLDEDLNATLERAKSNLLNTSLFNFITVEPVYYNDTNISIYITVEERWYWWPIPIFEVEESNFNTWWIDKDYDKVNYGLFLYKENFRGRKERLMFLVQPGYTEKAGIKYSIPYINKNKTNGLNMEFSYSRNHEISYATRNNSREFYKSETNYIQKEIYTGVGYELRPKLYNKHVVNLGYTNVEVSDSVVFYNNDFLSGGKNEMEFLSIKYTLKRDKRNFKNYPTIGYYFDLKLNKDGLGLIDDKLNSFYLSSHLKKFWQLSNRFYFATSLKVKYTMLEGPYYFYTGLGPGNNLVRGYELYLINGEHFGVYKAQLRYSLLQNKVFNLRAVKLNKFNKIPLNIYLGAYFDAGYVDSKVNSSINSLTNKGLYGAGASVDFVSYYDMVLRVEYSINKLNEKGLFLHFIAPI